MELHTAPTATAPWQNPGTYTKTGLRNSITQRPPYTPPRLQPLLQPLQPPHQPQQQPNPPSRPRPNARDKCNFCGNSGGHGLKKDHLRKNAAHHHHHYHHHHQSLQPLPQLKLQRQPQQPRQWTPQLQQPPPPHQHQLPLTRFTVGNYYVYALS